MASASAARSTFGPPCQVSRRVLCGRAPAEHPGNPKSGNYDALMPSCSADWAVVSVDRVGVPTCLRAHVPL